MSVKRLSSILKILKPSLQIQTRDLHKGKPKFVTSAVSYDKVKTTSLPTITSAVPVDYTTAKVIFNNDKTTDFKYVWLRDNCKCPKCYHAGAMQRLLDTPSLDMNIRPKSVNVNENGNLHIIWEESEGEHSSEFDSEWLFSYAQDFMSNNFAGDNHNKEHVNVMPDYVIWEGTKIMSPFPEVTYDEFMQSDDGLRKFLEIFYKYGLAFLRGVPTTDKKIVDVAKRISYVKETQYGVYFDMKDRPYQNGAHIAYSGGDHLVHHTDLNYRENSPGMEMLHCLNANDPKVSGKDLGGKSFFVDGFYIANWIKENKPADFNLLTSIPLRYSIKHEGMLYSQAFPVICLDGKGNVNEVHLNNRTTNPLQAPPQVIVPFYNAYKLFFETCREPANNLGITLVPGDLVAFNNRRILHGRTAYDPSVLKRHLQGVYMELDEAHSKFDQLQRSFLQVD